MAITDSQKVDYLYKKLGFGVAKTDTSTIKSPSNESIASPLLLRGDTVWGQSDLIPTSAPVANASVVTVYTGTSSVQTVNDITASTNRTWKTNLTNWIGTEFGSTYQLRAWAAPAGTANAAATGTRLFPDGSGNNDAWFFDYQSGVLNFSDTNVPTAVAGNVVFIEGYRYTGTIGITNASANTGNISFSNTTITSTLTNGNITLDPTGTGNVIILGNTGVAVTTISSSQLLVNLSTNSTSTNTGALVVVGGVGIGGNLNVSGTANVANLIVAGGSFTNVNLGNITITNTTISSTLVEGNVTIKPSGNGLVYLDTTTALTLPIGTTAQEPVDAPAGSIRYNTDIGSVEYFNGSTWVPTTSTIESQVITPNGTSSTFTLNRSTTTGGVLVLLNGVMQTPVTAYTVSGNQITFNEVPLTTDHVDIRFIASGELVSSDIKANPNATYVGSVATTIDSYSINSYRTAKYLVQVSDTANVRYQSSEILVTHNGTTPTISVYGTVYTSSNLAGFTATISSGNVVLQATTTGANCSVKVQKTYIAV